MESQNKENKNEIGNFSLIITVLIGILFYKIIGINNFPIFILMTSVISGLINYSFYSGLKNASRMWETFYVKLNENDIEFCFDKPVINEFEKTRWRKENQSISWENIKIKTEKKITNRQKKSILDRSLFGKGGLVIPKNIEDYDRLVSEIKKNIIIDTQ
jgi:hypothetical protein